jgi:hypothetical protein
VGVYEMKKPKRINSFSVTLFFVTVTVAYLGYWYLPEWWPMFQLTGIMRGICNDAYRTYEDEKLVDKLLKESKRTGLRLTKENFLLERVKYTAQEMNNFDQNQQLTFGQRGKKCILYVKYHKRSPLPFIGKEVPLSWEKSVETDLSTVKY